MYFLLTRICVRQRLYAEVFKYNATVIASEWRQIVIVKIAGGSAFFAYYSHIRYFKYPSVNGYGFWFVDAVHNTFSSITPQDFSCLFIALLIQYRKNL